MSKKKKVKKGIPPKQPKRKVKIKYKNIFIFLFLLGLLSYGIYFLLKLPITNIYIKGNTYLKDQEIIELLGIEDYPPISSTFSFSLDQKIKKQPLLQKIKITHKNIRELHIEVTENIPLFYNASAQKTVLKDGREIEDKISGPVLLNYVPDKKYKVFKEKMAKVSVNILHKISEIKYDPNDKDDERFLMSMNDGNYAYVTLGYFDRIDTYLDIMTQMSKKFDGKKGILYLDSGGYFQVLE